MRTRPMGGRRLGALALAAAATTGCGGMPAEPFTETRSIEFTVTVAAPEGALADAAFFRDEALTRSGVEVRSTARLLATPGAAVLGQTPVAALETDFAMEIEFDASDSIDDFGRDPDGHRFEGADIVMAHVAERTPAIPVRMHAFRSTFAGGLMGLAGPFAVGDAEARGTAVETAKRIGAHDFSPALSATDTLLKGLTPGLTHVLLLLTDGENNTEDERIVGPLGPCTTGGERVQGCSSNIEPLVTLAAATSTRIFVAGLGSADGELDKFRQLAERTGGAFVKATRPEELGPQFRNLALLIADGGVVVRGRTEPVELNIGGEPYVGGWLRYRLAEDPAGTVRKVQF